MCVLFFFFKQKTAYEMRISDWSSDVCSSDLAAPCAHDRENIPRLRSPPRHRAGATTAGCRLAPQPRPRACALTHPACGDRKSAVEGKSVSVRVELGGRLIIKQKTPHTQGLVHYISVWIISST